MKPLENRAKPKGSLLSPYTQACVNHLLDHGPSTLAQLDSMIQSVGHWAAEVQAIKADSTTRLRRLMHELRERGHVHCVVRNDEMLLAHGPHPAAVDAAIEAEAAAVADTNLYVGVVVPPPQMDLMHAPTYVPPAGPALRAGALDYKRCASFGTRC